MANTVINTPELLNLDSTTGATVLAKGTISQRPSRLLNVDYLVVAGGGGGGGTTSDAPGGGGAGGLITSYGNSSGGGTSSGSAFSLLISTNYTVTVGQGGNGGVGKNPGTDGANSVFYTITSTGGGGGGTSEGTVAEDTGRTGGSAGGSGTGLSSAERPSTPAVSNPVQGYAGGASITSSGKRGGGGGGAGESGNTNGQGHGGDGLEVSITGSAIFYAGGGGGGYFGSTSSVPGGSGGGGDCPSGSNGNGGNGTDNTGGGGGAAKRSAGGGSRNGGDGGDGVVILRYPNNYTINVGAGLTSSTTPDGLDKVTTFTQGTGTITFSGTTVTNQNNAIDGTLRFNTDTNKTEYYDGNSWYEIVDEYASGYDGIPTNYFKTKLYTGNGGTQSIGGYINGSASFNGSNSKIDLPNNILPNNSTASSSCSFWFKSSSGNSTGDSETIIDAWSYSTSEPGWGLFMEPAYGGFPDGQLYLANYYLGGTSGGTGNVTFRDGNWHFGVVVLDFSGGTIKVYIDGNSTPVLSQTVSSSNVDVFTTNAAIGYQNANPSYPRHFNGAIDQVRIYSDALTTSEIGYLFTNENSTTAGQLNPSGFPTNCVAAYTMDTSANGILNTQDLSTVDYPAGAGCLALYEMNGNSNDTSGTYNGTPTNITYEGGAFGQAAVFNGSSSKIALNSSISSIFTDNFTFSAWVYPADNSNYICLLSAEFGMELYFYQGQFQLYSNNTNNGTSRNIFNFGTTTTNYAINQWYHVALVFTKTSQAWYINGQQNGTNTTSSYTPYQASLISIGYFERQDGGANHYVFNGLIDQVRIYNTALTQSQITTLARGIATSYSGVATNVNFNGHLDFQPDFVWIKSRDDSRDHRLFDSVRGATKGLYSNLANAQFTENSLIAFNTNGFSLGSAGNQNVSNEDYVSWNWKAGGTAVTNNDGTIASQVSADKDSGFSIVKYVGNGTSGATIGHGLGAQPDIAFFKNLDHGGNYNWSVYSNTSATGATGLLYLNLTDAFTTTASRFNDTEPTASVITLGNDPTINDSGDDHIAYCWHSVAGYSKIGTYTGDGTTSGNIITTGFEPSFLLTKPAGPTGGYWYILDNKRSTTNPRNDALFPNDNLAEIESTNYNVDFLPTGFELKNNTIGYNQNNETYLYMAFA